MRRLLAGMSQVKLADMLGITFQQVQKYEKGSNRVSASRLQGIANTLEVPVSFFFDGASEGVTPSGGRIEDDTIPEILNFPATREGVQLTKAFVKIKSPLVRQRIIDLAESLAEHQD
jgi:transcriptional regulator with XRE-family HTH domain